MDILLRIWVLMILLAIPAWTIVMYIDERRDMRRRLNWKELLMCFVSGLGSTCVWHIAFPFFSAIGIFLIYKGVMFVLGVS